MVSLHSGSNKQLIYIETDELKLYISGSMTNKKAETIKAGFNQPASFSCLYNGDGQITVKTIVESGELAVNNGIHMFPCFFEDSNYQLLLEKKKEANFEIYHVSDEIRNNVSNLGENLLLSFSFAGEIGLSTFKVIVNGRIILTLTIEVFPSKMDYMKDYKEIMKEVNEEIAALAFEFLGKTFHNANLKDVKYQTSNEFFKILDYIFAQLDKALSKIKKMPKHNMIQSQEVKKLEIAKKPSKANINYILKHPEFLIKSPKGIEINNEKYISSSIIEVKKKTTFDIFENRYVKYMLNYILRRLGQIKKRLRIEYKDDNEYYRRIIQIEQGIKKHLNGFYRDIGEIQGKKSMTLVFQMAPGYREVYRYFILLKKGLNLSEDLYSITPKKLWKLYEMWCYIKLHNILRNMGYDVIHYGIIKAKDNGLTLSLIQDEDAVMTYSNKQGKQIELWYNKSYSSLPTTDQRPDTVLCLKKVGMDDRIYIFDAKYRLQVDNYGIIGPVEDDINVMHRYRDAIVAELEEKMEFKYKTFGAYVMFPYGNESEFKNHRFYKSIEKVNIGAFPMLPGSTFLIENHLQSILNESSLEANERLLGHIALDDDYSKFKIDNVMVANVKDKAHLEVYVKNRFYHIPVKKLTNIRLGIEYIALYESKRSFTDGEIKYYGKIKSIKRYKRNECRELPSASNDEYLRFEFEDIYKIGPIKSVEYGVPLISYTTLYLLQNAESIHELKMKNRDEILIYKKLKEVSKINNIKLKRFKDYYELGDKKIELLENKKIRVNGRIFDIGEIMDSLG